MTPTAYDSLALLRAGIPLSLLLDLAGEDPHSEELYAYELPDDLTVAAAPAG